MPETVYKNDLKATGKMTAEGGFYGTLNGGMVGEPAISKADDYALAAAEKAFPYIGVTMTAASKTLILGLSEGQVAFVKNEGATNAFTLKNVSGDTGTSLATGKVALVVASATADATVVNVLN